jgi:hypothetical protein
MDLWIPVHGFEGIYEITASGAVRRCAGFWCRAPRELKKHISNTGYERVKLTNCTRQGVKKTVHRLVYEHFIGPIPDGMTVNHRNGNKLDNRACNLELATQSEQMHHAYRTGLQKRACGEARGKVAKLTEDDVREIRRAYVPRVMTYDALAARFGVTQTAILAIVKRRTWTHI